MPALLSGTGDDINKAADLLCSGALVAFPTETVYGLGGDATNDRAFAAIFAARGRPSFNPLITHLADSGQAAELAVVRELGTRAKIARGWVGVDDGGASTRGASSAARSASLGLGAYPGRSARYTTASPPPSG